MKYKLLRTFIKYNALVQIANFVWLCWLLDELYKYNFNPHAAVQHIHVITCIFVFVVQPPIMYFQTVLMIKRIQKKI